MFRRVSMRTVTILAASLLFAVAVLGGPLIAIPIPLYLTEGCPGNYCFSNVPRLSVFPLLAGVLLVLALSGSWVRARGRLLALGVAMGLAGSLYVGLLEAAAMTFQDPYFTAPYHAYALIYVGFWSAGAGAGLWGVLRAETLPRMARALAGILLLVVALAAARGALRADQLVGSVALASVALGVGGAHLASSRVSIKPLLTERRVLLALVAVAFAFRAIFGLQTLARTGPGMAFAVASDDGDSYFTLASRLLADPATLSDVLGGRSFPPGYTLFLTAIFTPTGASLAAVVVVQALLAALSVVLLYLITRQFANATIALAGGALFAVNQNLIQNASTLTAEALLVPLMLFFLWALVRYQRSPRFWWIAAAAVALSLSFLTRNVVVPPLLVAALAWLFVTQRRRRFGSFARASGLLVVALVVASLPTAILSTAREGSPRLTSQLAALGWEWEGGPGMTVGNGFLLARGVHPFNDPLGSIRAVARDPLPILGFFAHAVPQRVSTLLFFSSPGLADPLKVVNPILRPNAFGEHIEILLLVALLLAIVAFVARRAYRDRPETGLLATFVILYVAVFAFVFPPYHPFRYRIPAEVVLSVAEAAGLVLVFRYALGYWSMQRRAQIADEVEAYARATHAIANR